MATQNNPITIYGQTNTSVCLLASALIAHEIINGRQINHKFIEEYKVDGKSLAELHKEITGGENIGLQPGQLMEQLMKENYSILPISSYIPYVDGVDYKQKFMKILEEIKDLDKVNPSFIISIIIEPNGLSIAKKTTKDGLKNYYLIDTHRYKGDVQIPIKGTLNELLDLLINSESFLSTIEMRKAIY